MSKIRISATRYTSRERAAEREIDTFLNDINAAPRYDVLADLRQISDS